jgi:hypothetical protein
MEQGVGTCYLTATQSAISLTFSRIGQGKWLIPYKAADPEEDTALFEGAQILFVGIWHSKAFFGRTSQTSFQVLRVEIPHGMLLRHLELKSWNCRLFRSLHNRDFHNSQVPFPACSSSNTGFSEIARVKALVHHSYSSFYYALLTTDLW